MPFEIVPGVTAGVGALAHAGIPLTQRGLSTSAVFVTAHDADDPQADEEWRHLASLTGTLVIYMGGTRVRAVTDRLTRTGVAQHARRVRVIARHEGGAGGPAVGGLAIRAGEAGALRRQAIDVGRVAHRVPVARERGRGQVVGNDEQHIRGGFHARRGCGDGGWDAGESGQSEKQG